MNDQMILAQNAVYSMDSRETGLNNNVIVCGTSGCGKTMSVSEPLLLETYDKSLIATVTKRRLVHKYEQVFRARGYQVLDLNFINPGESTVSFDPMQYIQTDADITFLAESVISMQAGGKARLCKDPYWDHAAVSLLSAEIAYVCEKRGSKASFLDVLEMQDSLEITGESSSTIRTTLDEEFSKAKEQRDEDGSFRFAISCWESFARMPYKTASCIYGVLNTVLDSVFTPELRQMFRKKKRLNFSKLARRKTVLFVSSSSVNPAIHGFINLFYAQAFKSLFEYAEKQPDGKLPIPVHMLCDDFATGGRIRSFPEYISIFREKQISVTLLIQSESQLIGMYGQRNATTIINNCDTYLYMGGMDLTTCRSISRRTNIPLEDVLYMPVGQAIVFRRGQRPLITERYDILRDERYQAVTEAYEPDPEEQEADPSLTGDRKWPGDEEEEYPAAAAVGSTLEWVEYRNYLKELMQEYSSSRRGRKIG